MLKNKFGLIGYPLTHSYSSFIHQSIFKINNIKATYNLIEIEPQNLEKKIKDLKNLNGFNVTSPFKTKIIKYLDDITMKAKKCQSVNTVLNLNNKLIGYNTDIYGFSQAIKIYNISLTSKVCVLGFGGAAKTIIHFLEQYKLNITVAIRNYSLKKEYNIKKFSKYILKVVDIQNISGSYNLLINATPIEIQKNIEKFNFNEKIFKNINYFFDLCYNPPITELMKLGLKYNCKVFNGESMLLWQALKSQEIWFN